MAASGVATASFGAWPGTAEKTVDVAGQAGFVATSEVEAWVMPLATADHSVDEHVIEAIDVAAYYLADGSFRIIVSARVDYPQDLPINPITGRDTVQRHRLAGDWSIGWAWN